MTNPRDWLHFVLGLLVGGVVVGVAIGLPAVWIPSCWAALFLLWALN